jgi:hypothetical protein
MSNSNVTCNITIQIQDLIGGPNTFLNRIVPQLLFPSSVTAVFSGYQIVNPPNTFQIIPAGPSSAACVYVRNASTDAGLQLTYDTGLSTPTVTLSPGGVFLQFNVLIDLTEGYSAISNLVASPANMKPTVFEYLWAL